uniref:Cytochrome P450 n=1 Tax=Anopheles culicifacies TaxID=139723 RepID=A0A182M905_9DIPT
MSAVLLLLVMLIVYGVTQAYRKRRELHHIAAHFTYPKPHWLLGNVLEYPANDIPGIFETMVKLHEQYGQDLFNWGLLNDHMIIVSSATNVEKVAMAKKTEKSQIYDFIKPWLGQGLLISSGEKWFHRRKIITPTFHFKILEGFEIQDVLGPDFRSVPLTYSTLQNFPYLDMVVKESLRLLPPVSFIGRRLVEDIEMNGVTIPAGTDFTIPIYVIHRNPNVYPDPERFDPERFSDESTQRRGPYDYIPFSIGSRNCIGQRYALLEMKVSIVRMISFYRILPGDTMHEIRLKTDLVLRPDKNIPIKLIARP